MAHKEYIRKLQILISIFFIFISPEIIAQKCTCVQDFDNLVEKVRTNYAGYQDKISSKNYEEFVGHTEALRQKALQSSGDQCIWVLNDWLNFFHDKHLIVLNTNPEQIKLQYVNEKRINIDENELKEYYKITSKLDSIEAIWESNEGIKIGIVKDVENISEMDFIAIVIESNNPYWRVGQILLEFNKKEDGTYMTNMYLPDRKKMNRTSKINSKGVLEVGIKYGVKTQWGQIHPSQSSISESSNLRIPIYEKIDDDIILIKIPSFNSYYKPYLDSLISNNLNDLTNTPSLILDIRGNGGGSDNTFESLIPLAFTDTITFAPGAIWSSEENIKLWQQFGMELLIEKMKKELNSYVTFGSPRKIFSDTVYDLPRDIFVIINKWVASSGETFLLQMRQSEKVIVIGKGNTMGAVDYLNGNVLPLSCKERGMMLRYPTSKRSVNLPIGDLDATGISPDVIIDEQVKDVIGFVKQLLKSLNDSSKLDHTLNNLVHPKGYVTSDWNKLGRVKIEGKGKTPMILIPSLGFSAEVTYGEFMELNKAKYKMYAVTPAGYGGTPAPPMPKIGTSYGEAVWTNNTQKAILDLVNERQLKKPILVGHFINGTQVALKLAIDYPDKFGGVIIISGEPFRNGMSKAMIDKVMAPRWFKKVTPETWEKGNFDPSIYSIDNQVASMFGKIANNPELPTIIQYLCEFLATNVTSEMGDLKIPVLILEPEFTDKANEIPYAKYLLNSWSELKSKFGNNIEFITVKNTHVFIMHDNLKDLNNYIRKFLKKNGLSF